jgi:hypothetical protein
MKLIATMPLRNEAWVCGLSIRVALMWCDEIVIGNHASTDATGDILGELQAEYPGRVHVVSFPEDRWNEMQHRETLLEMARNHKATHIAIVDADEVMTGDVGKRLNYAASILGQHYVDIPEGRIIQLPLYNLRGSIHRYHQNGIWGQRITSVVFQDNPRLHWWQPSRTGEYQHHKREPRGMALLPYSPISQGRSGVMHLWGASERRLIAKHALYKMRDWIEHPELGIQKINRDYSQAIRGRLPHDTPETWTFAEVPAEWWEPYAGWMKYLDLKAVPWQEQACKDLMDKHGREAFVGLDLFGVV